MSCGGPETTKECVFLFILMPFIWLFKCLIAVVAFPVRLIAKPIVSGWRAFGDWLRK